MAGFEPAWVFWEPEHCPILSLHLLHAYNTLTIISVYHRRGHPIPFRHMTIFISFIMVYIKEKQNVSADSKQSSKTS